MTLKPLIIAALAAVALATTASAEPVCKDGWTKDILGGRPCAVVDGELWVVTQGAIKKPLTGFYPTDSLKKLCFTHAIKLLTKVNNNAGGVKMTKEQKFRGDSRMHNECDWDYRPTQATQTTLPPAAQHRSDTIEVRL